MTKINHYNSRRQSLYLFIYLVSLVVLSGCSNMKYIPEGEQLYTGGSVKLISSNKIKGKGALVKEAEKAIKPKPNGKILGLRVKLWIYNKAANTTKEKGFKHWLKYEVGEPPVFLSVVNPTATSEFISARVFNKGYFKSSVSYETIQNEAKNKARIEYNVFLQKPFIINSINYNTVKDTSISKIVESTFSNSLLKKGLNYDLDLLRQERMRIDAELKNRGYYFFSPDYLYYDIDSSSKEHNLDIYLNIKSTTPQKALKPYFISKVMIHVDSSDYDHSYEADADTTVRDSIVFVKNNPNFRAKPIRRAIFLRGGKVYSRQDHNQTLSRLGSLGVFKFVNLRITEDSTQPQGLLVSIQLTPMPKKSVRAELEAATKSNNFIGPSVTLGFTNRNLMKGAEKLNVSVHGSIETQFNGQFKGLYTYEIGPTVKYTLPRFLLPFKARVPRLSAPTTGFTVDYTYLKRVNYFDMQSLKFAMEYRWKEDLTKEHIISPVNITYLNISNISDDFNAILNTNPFLKQRYEDQLIAGITYSFTYNEQVFETKKNQFYFNGNIDISGNTVDLINKIAYPNDTRPKQIAGVNYAQYARFDIDVRDYYNFKPKTKFASRLIIGVGIPYGNSSALPYIKGFFAGGTNSLRAFPINSVGPGTYHLPDSLINAFYIQQGGDLKLEWNGEYRFPIWGFLRGGVFIDVGNTWLLRDNPLLPGGKFEASKFLGQLAVGTGFGLRADFNFFVIRLDLGIPLRKPWLPAGKEWVIDKFELSSPNWRSQNLVFNIAIGYPF